MAAARSRNLERAVGLLATVMTETVRQIDIVYL
jgi:hypothetical protein